MIEKALSKQMDEELVSLLKAITIQESTRDENLKKFLSRIEKDDVEISQSIGDLLLVLVKEKVDINILKIIADILKQENNRQYFIKPEPIAIFTSSIESGDENIVLQSLRCLCNAAADNEAVANLFMEANGVPVLLSKAKAILVESEKFHILIQPACSCIQNLICESSSLQERFLKEGALDVLWKFVEIFKDEKEEIACTCVKGIASLIEDSDLGLETLSSSGILKSMLNQLKSTNTLLNQTILKEVLLDLGKNEKSREMLCQNGCIEILLDCIESSKEFHETCSEDNPIKDLADLLTLISSGDESFSKFLEKNSSILEHFSRWLQSKNSYVQTTSGLALGNYARSEETCKNLVSHKIHENLINIIKENVDKEEFADRIQAFASCLRNLCVAESNKPTLYSSGLHDAAIDIVLRTPFMVQFRGLGILRLLTQNNSELSSTLCKHDKFLEKAVEIANRPMVTPVPYESQRCLASIVKFATEDQAALTNWIEKKCLSCMSFLLSSDHLIMKNEGLIAIIMLMVNLRDSLTHLKETDCIEKLFKLLTRTNEEAAQTLFNCLTLVQAIYSVEGGAQVLEENKVREVLHGLKQHQENVVRNKVEETLGLLS